MSDEGMALWKIDRALKEALDGTIDPETGEILDPSESEIEALSLMREDKILGCIAYIKNCRSESKMLGDAIFDLQSRKKVLDNAEERTSNYLDGLTDSEHDKGMKCLAGSLSWRKSSKTIIDDEESLPIGFFRLKRTVETAKIKKAIEGGSDIFEGIAHIEERQNFRVK